MGTKTNYNPNITLKSVEVISDEVTKVELDLGDGNTQVLDGMYNSITKEIVIEDIAAETEYDFTLPNVKEGAYLWIIKNRNVSYNQHSTSDTSFNITLATGPAVILSVESSFADNTLNLKITTPSSLYNISGDITIDLVLIDEY